METETSGRTHDTRIFSPLAAPGPYNATLSENKSQHVCRRLQELSSKFEGFECGQHLDFKFLVMDIQRLKILRRTTALGSTHSGQYRFDHLLAKDQQRRQRADAGSAHPVPPRFTDPFHKRLAPQ